MRYIIVDFEMNKLDKQYKEERKICCQEIIEIGAVMLNDRYQEISRFRTYIKPQYAEEIEGQQHDALSDAANTAELLKIVRNQHLFEEHLQVAKEALETKSLGNTLGSMFEFSGLLETIA